MSLKKRAIEGVVISGLLVTMSAVATSADMVVAEVTPVAAEVKAKTDLATRGTAGVVIPLNQMQETALADMEEIAANVEQMTHTLVAAAEEEVPVEPPLSEEELAWQNRLMADVQEFLYVRERAMRIPRSSENSTRATWLRSWSAEMSGHILFPAM